MHIAIAGNIGSGKTTLTKLLSKRYGWKPNFEPVDNNPYLADYYKDMERWSFNLQIYFLNKRFHDVVEISKSEENIIQDRTIFEDAKIFAPNLHEIGMMSDRDFANYTDLFDLMISLVKFARPHDLHPKQHPYPREPHRAPRQKLREEHPHRLPSGTQQSLRRMDQELQGQAHHHRWRPPQLRGEPRGLPQDYRPDRRRAVRSLPYGITPRLHNMN
jgi:ABC-type glutathione transport system ATPase component